MKTVHALWAAEAEAAEAGAHDREPTLADRLREVGFGRDDVSAVEELLEREATDRALHLAAAFLRELRERLKTESAAGAAVARVLGDPTAAAELGAAVGCTKQAVGAVVARLKPLFDDLAPGPKRARLRRPDLPGSWRTGPEIRAAVGISVDRLRRLGARPVRCGSRLFWEEGQVRRRLEELELSEAAKRAGR